MSVAFLCHPATKALLDRLDSNKDAFITEAVNDIAEMIKRKDTTDCLGLVARDSRGIIIKKYPASLDADFATALLLFCFKKDYKGNKLDSCLTDEIVAAFQKRYEKYINDHNSDISAAMLAALTSNDNITNRFAEALLNNKAFRLASKEVKKGVRDQIVLLLSQKVASSSVADIVGAKVSAGAAAVASTQIGYVIAQKLIVILGHKIGFLIAKAMALPAVKVAIAAAVKKVVIAAVVAAFFKMFAAKLGIGVGGLVLIVLVPLLIALLVREWNHFPEKLGQSIAASLRDEMGTSFRSTTETILNEVWDYLLGKGVGEIELELAGSEEIAKAAGMARKVLTA